LKGLVFKVEARGIQQRVHLVKAACRLIIQMAKERQG